MAKQTTQEFLTELLVNASAYAYEYDQKLKYEWVSDGGHMKVQMYDKHDDGPDDDEFYFRIALGPERYNITGKSDPMDFCEMVTIQACSERFHSPTMLVVNAVPSAVFALMFY